MGRSFRPQAPHQRNAQPHAGLTAPRAIHVREYVHFMDDCAGASGAFLHVRQVAKSTHSRYGSSDLLRSTVPISFAASGGRNSVFLKHSPNVETSHVRLHLPAA